MYVNMRTKMNFHCKNGHIWNTTPNRIFYDGAGCPYCSKQKLSVGENDLWTIRPDVAKLLNNPDDGYKVREYSHTKLEFVCPRCGSINVKSVGNVTQFGFSCNICSDGISYPNKFMRSVLNQLGINYVPEYMLNNNPHLYDFMLLEYNTIIEMHGEQHYTGWEYSKEDLLKQQSNDEEKYKYAISNGVSKYIVIDARESNSDFLSKNITGSNLNGILDLSNVDWKQCDLFATSSMVFRAAELCNDGKSVEDISKIMKISKGTIRRYLNHATELGLCDWKKRCAKQVILLNTKEIFKSASIAADKYNIKGATQINAVCQKKHKYAGLHPKSSEPLVWRYLEDYDENEIIDFMSLYEPCAKKKK